MDDKQHLNNIIKQAIIDNKETSKREAEREESLKLKDEEEAIKEEHYEVYLDIFSKLLAIYNEYKDTLSRSEISKLFREVEVDKKHRVFLMNATSFIKKPERWHLTAQEFGIDDNDRAFLMFVEYFNAMKLKDKLDSTMNTSSDFSEDDIFKL